MRMKTWRIILLIELGILATWILHHFVTSNRGYKAIGGEFLLIPLVYVVYTLIGQAVSFKEEVEQ